MRKIKLFSFLLGVIIISINLQGCKPKKTDSTTQSVEEQVEYPVKLIPNLIETSIDDTEMLYPLSEDFLEDFMEMAQNYEGMHVKTEIAFPEEWGLLSVENLPESRELWHLQSKCREWMYLVITSGMGTQRILDLLPVAVNLSVQKDNILQTELWTTRRESDGAFLVTKEYNWLRSIENVSRMDLDTNFSAYQNESHVIDKYYINDMSRFEFIPRIDSIEYSAVVFYYNQETKPEEWDEVAPILQSYCEEKGIFFDEIHSGYNNIKIRDFKMNDIAEVDITPYMGVSEAGMVMFHSNEEPKNVSFGSHERMMIEIRRYFNILNQE
ncbi:hypothetical protein LJC68_02230 [Bacteroidales bacterium OttesenSCG-928-B11]|nr:hypothetical protein [Bacteroidales bacterium OttesenSCG-928-E04]MDL2307960.1 hypothetical protein [Bacteroidales bacterium OttesenSCG-928-C03]MDL2311679.1 hypothetical protein [Bacteroidales bacterium OttesenSCG-928-B11]MDL2325750.1 hypothetical protein [Bacteroidales bacterium OttesenSCG-928-A14]